MRVEIIARVREFIQNAVTVQCASPIAGQEKLAATVEAISVLWI